MEENFCHAYTAIGEDTCGNGTQAAKAALYSSPGNAAWKLLKRPKIRERIHQIHKERMDRHMITPEGVLFKLEHLRIKAENKGDLVTSKGCVELQGKYLSMFSDRIVGDFQQHERLDQMIETEAQLIGKIRINEILGAEQAGIPIALPQIQDAEFIPREPEKIPKSDEDQYSALDSDELLRRVLSGFEPGLDDDSEPELTPNMECVRRR